MPIKDPEERKAYMAACYARNRKAILSDRKEKRRIAAGQVRRSNLELESNLARICNEAIDDDPDREQEKLLIGALEIASNIAGSMYSRLKRNKNRTYIEDCRCGRYKVLSQTLSLALHYEHEQRKKAAKKAKAKI